MHPGILGYPELDYRFAIHRRPQMKATLWLIAQLELCIIFITSTVEAVPASLWTYPATGHDAYKSRHYTAEVAQGGRREELFVYQMLCPWHHYFSEPYTAQHFAEESNWLSFSFSGEVAVTVKPVGITLETVELRPASAGVTAAIDDGKVRITVTRPGQYFVLINGKHGMRHPLFVFASPPEEKAPGRDSRNLHYFGPGVHEIGYQYRIKANETVYLAGGALVRGSLYYEGDNVTIRGRGILTDKRLMMERIELAKAERAAGKANAWDINHDKWYAEKRATIYGNGRNARIEGITIIESPFYVVRTDGWGAIFSNLKLLGDLYNNNGIIAGPNHRILDCFLKVEDDVFCWMSPNSETRNCVIWKQDNACMVQFGYGYSYATANHVFVDNTVIVDQTRIQCMARGLFGLASSIGTKFTDCRIENLKVYGDTLNFLAIDNFNNPTPWSSPPGKEIRLRPIKLHFKNVEITGTERGDYWGERLKDLQGTPMRSRLRTRDEGSIEIILENVHLNGKRLRGDKDWPNGLLKEGDVTTIYK